MNPYDQPEPTPTSPQEAAALLRQPHHTAPNGFLFHWPDWLTYQLITELIDLGLARAQHGPYNHTSYYLTHADSSPR